MVTQEQIVKQQNLENQKGMKNNSMYTSNNKSEILHLIWAGHGAT